MDTFKNIEAQAGRISYISLFPQGITQAYFRSQNYTAWARHTYPNISKTHPEFNKTVRYIKNVHKDEKMYYLITQNVSHPNDPYLPPHTFYGKCTGQSLALFEYFNDSQKSTYSKDITLRSLFEVLAFGIIIITADQKIVFSGGEKWQTLVYFPQAQLVQDTTDEVMDLTLDGMKTSIDEAIHKKLQIPTTHVTHKTFIGCGQNKRQEHDIFFFTAQLDLTSDELQEEKNMPAPLIFIDNNSESIKTAIQTQKFDTPHILTLLTHFVRLRYEEYTHKRKNTPPLLIKKQIENCLEKLLFFVDIGS